MLPFTNTNSNYKKWEISSRQIDVTEQYTPNTIEENNPELVKAVERRIGRGYSSSRIIASAAVPITGTLTLNRQSQLVATSAINSKSVFTISLSSPVVNEINEYIFIFKTSGTIPVITYPSGIKWRGKSPILVIDATWTMVFENVYNGTTWEVYGIAIKNDV